MVWSLTVGSRRIEFGAALTGLGLVSTPVVKPVIEVDSYVNPRGDGRRFGRMWRRGQVVSLAVEARPDGRPIEDVWRDLLSVWRADNIRGTSGRLARLTADSGLSAYGLPVDVDPNQEHRLFNIDRVVLGFEAVDDLWYGPVQETVVGFAPPVGGGLRFPARAPFRFGGQPTVRNSSVVVDGSQSAWPVFEVVGPIANPVIEVEGLGRLVISASLAYDERVVLDTRPWARTVMRGKVGGALSAFPAALSPSGLRLSDMALSPGAHSINLRGSDPSGVALVRVRVEPAFTSF